FKTRRPRASALFPYTTLFRSMMMIARGAVLELTQGQNVLQLGDFVVLGQGSLGFLPLPTLFLIIITAVIWYLMTQTRYGRSLYRSEEHTSELQSRENLVCRLL